jgi:hypothetical protein
MNKLCSKVKKCEKKGREKEKVQRQGTEKRKLRYACI